MGTRLDVGPDSSGARTQYPTTQPEAPGRATRAIRNTSPQSLKRATQRKESFPERLRVGRRIIGIEFRKPLFGYYPMVRI